MPGTPEIPDEQRTLDGLFRQGDTLSAELRALAPKPGSISGALGWETDLLPALPPDVAALPVYGQPSTAIDAAPGLPVRLNDSLRADAEVGPNDPLSQRLRAALEDQPNDAPTTRERSDHFWLKIGAAGGAIAVGVSAIIYAVATAHGH